MKTLSVIAVILWGFVFCYVGTAEAAPTQSHISLFEKIFLKLLENILTNQSGPFELPPTGVKIFVHRAWDL